MQTSNTHYLEQISTLAYYGVFTLLIRNSFLVQAPGACIIKHDRFVMYGLRSKLVSLLAQARVFVRAKRH